MCGEYKDCFVDGATWAKNIKQAEIDKRDELIKAVIANGGYDLIPSSFYGLLDDIQDT